MSFSTARAGRSNSITSFVCRRGSWCWKPRPSAERSRANSILRFGHSARPAVSSSMDWPIRCCAEPGARVGVGGFSGRPAGADMRLRCLGRPSAVCTGDRGRGRFRSRSTVGAVDFLCRAEPARTRCGVAAARARGGEERWPPCDARGLRAPPAGRVPGSASGVISWAPGICLDAPKWICRDGVSHGVKTALFPLSLTG